MLKASLYSPTYTDRYKTTTVQYNPKVGTFPFAFSAEVLSSAYWRFNSLAVRTAVTGPTRSNSGRSHKTEMICNVHCVNKVPHCDSNLLVGVRDIKNMLYLRIKYFQIWQTEVTGVSNLHRWLKQESVPKLWKILSTDFKRKGNRLNN